MIRYFRTDDIIYIEQTGHQIDDKFKLKINDYSRCIVYEKDNMIVGFIVFSMIYETAEIIDMAVMKEYQGQGIGSQLFVFANNECINNGCGVIMLEVRSGNKKAISFYKKNGFKKVIVRRGYYRDGEDAFVMEKLVV